MKLAITNTSEVTPVNKYFLVMMLLFSVMSEAQTAKPDKAQAKKQVRVKFGEDELINGSNPAPEVEFIFEKANFNYKKLIRLRENFIPEADAGREGFGTRE